MKNKIKQNKKSAKGFTLIELLVVVVIVGILAAIALPQYKKAVLKSRFATMKDIVRVVTEAQQRYFLTNGEYTTKATNLDITYLLNTESIISFNGGRCPLHWWSKPNEGIICILNTNPQIAISNAYGSSIKACRVIDIPDNKANTLQDEICKQETGKNSPDYSGSGSNYYYY